MLEWPTLIPLAVSVVAVVISAAALVLAGRREDRRWKREVLVETMVSLFDNSFGILDRAAFEARQSGRGLEWHKDRALNARAAQLRALTRLRFLAKPKVVERALDLVQLEDNLYSLLFKNPLDIAQYEELLDQRRVARSRLVNACRRNLGLWRALPISPYRYMGPSPQEIASHEMKRQRSAEPHPVSIGTYRSSYGTARVRRRPTNRPGGEESTGS